MHLLCVVHISWDDQAIGKATRKFSETWASFKVKECFEKVETEDIGRLSIAQDIFGESTDFLRAIIAPVGGVGGVTLSYVSSLGLHVVVLHRARRRQQQEEEAV